MKKKIISLLFLVLISTFISSSTFAFSTQFPSSLQLSSSTQLPNSIQFPNNMISNFNIPNSYFLNINKKDAEEIYKETLSALRYQMYIELNWNNLKIEQDMDLYSSNDKALGKPGDILITVFDSDNHDINAICLGSLTTHAAFVDSDPSKVLEVLPGGVQNGENDWRTRYKKVLVLRPNLDKKTVTSAIEYGHTKIGTPFNFNFFDKTTTNKFYCSEFVWRCFMNSGVDLDGNGGKAVFPYDFIQSSRVSIVYKQGE